MPRTSELTDRITELLERQDELNSDELEEIAMYESDERLTPVDTLNIGIVFNCQERYIDALRCFGDALDAYETPGEKQLIAYTHAHIGAALHQFGTQTLCGGNKIEAMGLYGQSSKAYVKAIEKIEFLPQELLPVIFSNAAVVFFNVGEYSKAFHTCVMYQTLQSNISSYTTEHTDDAIEIVLKKVMEKLKPLGQG